MISSSVQPDKLLEDSGTFSQTPEPNHLVSPDAAPATLLWNWSYQSNLYAGSGTFTTESTTTAGEDTDSSFTGYLITSMSGDWNGLSVTLLAPGNLEANDNLLSASDQFNLFCCDNSSSSNYRVLATVSPDDLSGTRTFSATQQVTPEPATTALVALALGLVAVVESVRTGGTEMHVPRKQN
jgi:hypothetical protein